MAELNLKSLLEYIRAVRVSPLFDANWYKTEYQLQYQDPATHYVLYGWQKGCDPSKFFSTNEYLKRFPEVNDCPLVHYEFVGLWESRYRDFVDMPRFREAHPELLADLKDGLLRVRITNQCNAKCRYCGVHKFFSEENKQRSMDKVWLFEGLRPIYEQVRYLLLTGGDPLFTPHSYEYLKFIKENYPYITVFLETNGILFNDKVQQLAIENLMLVHVSVNASNEEVYAKSCWDGSGGEKYYRIFTDNIKKFVSKLADKNMLCFAPDVSMVVNHDNYFDVVDFAKMALQFHTRGFGYYFDYTENDMMAKYFSMPEIFRPVLKQLLEIERVLKNKVSIGFRLWIPTEEVSIVQPSVDAESDEELAEKYSELLDLAKDRSIEEEHADRNWLRKRFGKSQLTFDEDFAPTLRMKKRDGRDLCFAAWSELDFYPDGRLDFCSWYVPTLNINNFINEDGSLDWNEVVNSYEYMRGRHAILLGDYDECLQCCPMNNAANPIVDVFKYTCPNQSLDSRRAREEKLLSTLKEF